MSAGFHRRTFLAGSAAAVAATLHGWRAPSVSAQAPPGERPEQDDSARIIFPRARLPLTFIIDDSTCLVNMGHFCIPQFHACYPDRAVYQKPWQTFPREIPDLFVREFGEWCAARGVKGKYSIVPYPACTGWLDRELPGWSRKDLQDSLQLVRDLMLPNWDIHPEMITHTRVIDLKTGRPLEEISPATMENSWPRQPQSVDQIAEYLAYALRILRNCGLPCEGITTPGGFGNLVKPELSLAVQQAVRDVFPVEIPHYFKYVIDGDGSTEPVLEHVSGLASGTPELTVNIPAGTGDWFGGWEGDVEPRPDLYAYEEATSGRLVELLLRGQPGFFLCHWPGMYSNGTRSGFRAFQRVVDSVHSRFSDRILWMKLSEIARYWATKELTEIRRLEGRVALKSLFDCPDLTLSCRTQRISASPVVSWKGEQQSLREVRRKQDLVSGTWFRDEDGVVVCFDVRKGHTEVLLS